MLTHDAALFHSWAVSLAESIKTNGWQSWSLYPPPTMAGNVAILGALYALFGPDPSVMIPLNAAVHALGGVLIYALGRHLWPGRIGTVGGVIAASLFVTFPSSLTWYGQVHKDTYAIAGSLLILLGWLRIARGSIARKAILGSIALQALGAVLIGLVRPYFLVVVLCAGLTVFVIIAVSELLSKNRLQRWTRIGPALAGVLVLSLAARSGSEAPSPSLAAYGEGEGSTQGYVDWHPSSLIPASIDHYFEKAARMRGGLIKKALEANAGSTIDADRKPDSVASVVAYLPRALEVSLLAPFPTTWLQRPSLMRLVGAAETLLWYLLIPGVLVTLVKRPTLSTLICGVYCVFFLCILGFIHANVGTLYRYRYPFLFPLILAGVMGWLHVFASRRRAQPVLEERVAEDNTIALRHGESAEQRKGSVRRTAAVSGVAVMALTLVGYLGLFARDVLMTRLFGMAQDLDAFYLAMLVPTFLASVLAFPIGEASIPAFLSIWDRNDGRSGEVNAFSEQMAFLTLISFIALGAVIVVFGEGLLALFGRRLSSDTIQHAISLLDWTVPLLMLSAISVLGYALLNGVGKAILGSAAQLVVPVAAIAAMLAFAKALGVGSAGLGMVLGQVASIVVVYACLKQQGISLLPKWHGSHIVRGSLGREYLWLTVAALCAYASVPVSYYFVSSLQSGSIAAWAIGSKVVLFFTGIVNAGLTAVILPYFSRIAASHNNDRHGRRELRALLGAGTALSISFATMIFLGSEPLIRLFFESKRFSSADVEAVSHVVRYGVVQLPFFVTSALLFKFAIASKQSWQVVAGMTVGTGINALLNMVLIGRMGISGIALATALSVGVSSGIVLTVSAYRAAIAWLSVAVIGLSWLLFLTLILCLHFASYPGAVVATLALVVILSTNFGYWHRRNESMLWQITSAK